MLEEELPRCFKARGVGPDDSTDLGFEHEVEKAFEQMSLSARFKQSRGFI
jgi:hypothetical protein